MTNPGITTQLNNVSTSTAATLLAAAQPEAKQSTLSKLTPWLPSACLALAMLVLVFVSFICYHCRYVKKKRKAIMRELEFKEYIRPEMASSFLDEFRDRVRNYSGRFRYLTTTTMPGQEISRAADKRVSIAHDGSVQNPDNTSLHLQPSSAEETMFSRSPEKMRSVSASDARSDSERSSITELDSQLHQSDGGVSFADSQSENILGHNHTSSNTGDFVAQLSTKTTSAKIRSNFSILSDSDLVSTTTGHSCGTGISDPTPVEKDTNECESAVRIYPADHKGTTCVLVTPLCALCLLRQTRLHPLGVCRSCISNSVKKDGDFEFDKCLTNLFKVSSATESVLPESISETQTQFSITCSNENHSNHDFMEGEKPTSDGAQSSNTCATGHERFDSTIRGSGTSVPIGDHGNNEEETETVVTIEIFSNSYQNDSKDQLEYNKFEKDLASSSHEKTHDDRQFQSQSDTTVSVVADQKEADSVTKCIQDAQGTVAPNDHQDIFPSTVALDYSDFNTDNEIHSDIDSSTIHDGTCERPDVQNGRQLSPGMTTETSGFENRESQTLTVGVNGDSKIGLNPRKHKLQRATKVVDHSISDSGFSETMSLDDEVILTEMTNDWIENQAGMLANDETFDTWL